MPTAIPVTPSSMNYTSVVFVGFTGISAIYWVVRGRTTFRGPPVPSDDAGNVVVGKEGDVESENSLPQKVAHKI